jgi:hypothetical protein
VSTEYSINSLKDFEIIWIDFNTHQPKDMNNVTFEMYHYEESRPGRIVVPVKEPYIITEDVSDLLNIASFNPSASSIVDVEVKLDLNIIVTQLAGLGCPSNDFVVCGTNSKVAIVNGQKKASLSACELATLINVCGASGYTASTQDGFLVLSGDSIGSAAYLEVGTGTINPILGIIAGDTYPGSDTQLVFDIPVTPMTRVSAGRYVYTNVNLSSPPFSLEERYFVIYRSVEPITLQPEISEEDFVLISNGRDDFNYSFTR